MSWSTAEHLVLESGKSGELVAAFHLVMDVTTEGEAKFSRSVCRQLARVISCRNYAPAVLELCHLVVIAEACGEGPTPYEEFFWNSGPARTGKFRALVRGRIAAAGGRDRWIAADEAKVDLRYPDGLFAIAFSRMPFLSALMEFLITTVGYCELDDLWSDMLCSGPTNQGVSATANRVSKLLYGYLAAHLPSAQNLRKFSCLTAHLEALSDGDFGPEVIDDDVVMDFWVAHSGSKRLTGVDFRTYVSVFQAFVSLRRVLEEARDLDVLSPTERIGLDREAGEVDPSEVSRLLETADEMGNTLDRLREPPAGAIKFMTQSEIRVFERVIACGKVSRDLPLSLMRCEIFGASQSRMTQARRRKLTAPALHLLIDDGPGESYEDRRQRLLRASKQIDKILLASLHALTLVDARQALALLVKLNPDIDYSVLGQSLLETVDRNNIVPLQGAMLSEGARRALGDPGLVGEEVAEVLGEARKAYQSVNRRGFSDDCLEDPEVAEGFVQGAPALLELREQLFLFCSVLSRARLPCGTWDRQFQTDCAAFRKQFHVLYGETQ